MRAFILSAFLINLLIGIHARSLPTLQSEKYCQLPENGAAFSVADPSDVNLDPIIVQKAITYASTHNRLSVQIFRNNCKVATSILDPLTDEVPFNVFSSTKSVISILTGMAYDQGKLHLDDAIDKYLPKGPGWGDAAHRNITIRNLLTETAGLREAILAEFASVLIDPNVAQEALAQPLQHTPGTHFEYTQRVPDLLSFVVQQAIGQDLQAFAQDHLFGPIGIPKNGYFWLHDRSGITYGYAHLFIKPSDFAKLGLFMQNGGEWNGKRLLSKDYIQKATAPSPQNPCYSFLFWNNEGQPCTAANIPSTETLNRRAIPPAPKDAYAMVGALQQNNFIIPSLNMTVTWTGVFGDYTSDPPQFLSASPGPLYWDFFEILMRAVKDVNVPDAGPYVSPPLDLDFNPSNYLSVPVLLKDLFPSKFCNVVFCQSTIPIQGLIENIQSIVGTVLGF
ncbi:hypothetical protein L7F22_067900 [Adiantum nelumboides]|nr:hypothetical protein [Adiantum nelumboides]